MGNHHASHAGDRRTKECSGGGGMQAGQKLDGTPLNIDKPRTVSLKSQVSEEDHAPVFCKSPKTPDTKEEPMRYIPPGNRKMLPCVIKWPGGGQKVALSGTFNQWQKIPMVKSEKDFVAIVDLPEGEFEYKFEVDGEWKVNPSEQKKSGNEGHNVIIINESDFEELENELLKDPNDVNMPGPYILGNSAHLKPGEDENAGYGQLVPENKPNEKTKDPPVLPPHLLQVILNKDTPVSCEPTLLPEPNHVIVNHMYALSIRDGMMVLSTTHRYMKKSVTTLIYRPI
uniref:5'-AMP-activated protein kinase subunit beta-1 n=1 Tax=Hirondellea gigas TaxID=1518452 RepID=A0A2P2I4I8_9CRUS